MSKEILFFLSGVAAGTISTLIFIGLIGYLLLGNAGPY